MVLEEVKTEALQLLIADRWQLVQHLLASLQPLPAQTGAENSLSSYTHAVAKLVKTPAEFKASLQRLIHTFERYLSQDISPLSDYAVSRDGIYEDHP